MIPGHRFLALAALLALPFNAVSAAEQAGVTAAVQGDVDFLSVLDQKLHRATGGEEIYLGDEISSAPKSGMQLMLLDETIFTIGPDTDLSIDDFVYDPATGAGQMTASLTKGLFRFVAGNIAQGDPDDMQINLPTGTIGIRGTSGIIQILPGPGGPGGPGGSVLVVLLETAGGGGGASGMVVSSGGQTVELLVPGFGTVLVPGAPPTPPFIVEDSFFAEQAAFFSPGDADEDDGEPEGGPDGPGGPGGPGGPDGGPGGPDGPGDGGQFGGDFGDGGFLADGFGDFFGDGGFGGEFFDFDGDGGGGFFGDFNLAGDFGDFADFTQDCVEIDGSIVCDGVVVSDGSSSTISDFADVFTLLGTATYGGTRPFFQTEKLFDSSFFAAGIVTFNISIDFQNQLFCSSTCTITINTNSFGGNIDDFTDINSVNYSGFSGAASGIFSTGDLSNTKFTGTTVDLIDFNDGTTVTIANNLSFEVFYNDSVNGNSGSTLGTVVTDPR